MNSLHLKIESRRIITNFVKFSNYMELSLLDTHKHVNSVITLDWFLLPYKVKKLSKRARRNKM